VEIYGFNLGKWVLSINSDWYYLFIFYIRADYEKTNFLMIYSQEIDRLWVINTGSKLVWIAIGNAVFNSITAMFLTCFASEKLDDEELETIGGILEKEKKKSEIVLGGGDVEEQE
jgi:hypothetical protein